MRAGGPYCRVPAGSVPSFGTTVTSTKNFVASGSVDLWLTGTRWNAIYGTTTNTTSLVVGTSLNAYGS